MSSRTERKASKKAQKELAKEFEETWTNPMKKPYWEKIVLNIGVGAGGEELERASTVLETISGKKAVKTLSKKNIKEFNLRIGRPIGTKVTIRGEEAGKLLKRLLVVNNDKILRKSFDNYGIDVVGRIVRPGMRVRYRRKGRAKIPKHHYVSKLEAQYFLEKNFGVDIVDKLELEYL